jgi:hypothetical protein
MLLLFLLLWQYVWATPQRQLVMNKVRVMNSPENRVSVKMHSYSPEMTPLHAALQFYGNQSAYHGALIIDRLNMMKYRRIASAHSALQLGNHIEVVAASGHHTFSYHQVQSMHDNAYTTASALDTSVIELLEMTGVLGISAAGSVAYDATLMLDQYSGVWNNYNVARFNRHRLTLSYETGGALPAGTGEYSGVARLPCAQSPTEGPCLVQSALRVNGASSAFQLLLDFNSPFNYLPPELYERWSTQARLILQLESNNDALPLTKQLAFQMHDASTVVLGADAVHKFSQVAYSTEHPALHVWYYETLTTSYAQHEAVSVFLVLFDLVTLVCMFAWGTSYNYFVLDYIVHFYAVARNWHYFAYKQVFQELLVMLVAALQWLLIGLYSWNGTATGSDQDARTILLIAYSMVQFVLMLLLLTLWRDPVRRAFNWYTPQLYFLFQRVPPPAQGKARDLLKMTRPTGKRAKEQQGGLPVPLYKTMDEKQRAEANRTTFYDIQSAGQQRRLYEQVVKNYHDPVCKPPTAVTVARNLVFSALLFSNLAMVFNFFSENSLIDQTWVVALCLGLTFFSVRFLVVGVLYMQRLEAPFRAHHAWFVCFMVLEVALLAAFTALAYKYSYMPFFRTTNTGYDQIVLTTVALITVAVVFLFAIIIATGKVGDYNERFIELLERRVALATSSA